MSTFTYCVIGTNCHSTCPTHCGLMCCRLTWDSHYVLGKFSLNARCMLSSAVGEHHFQGHMPRNVLHSANACQHCHAMACACLTRGKRIRRVHQTTEPAQYCRFACPTSVIHITVMCMQGFHHNVPPAHHCRNRPVTKMQLQSCPHSDYWQTRKQTLQEV